MPKKRNLRIYERDHLYPQCIAYYLDFLRLSPHKHPYVLNYWAAMSFGDQYFWARETDILEKNFRGWFKKWATDSRSRKFIYEKLGSNHHKLVKKLKQLQAVNIEKLTNRQLFDIRGQAMVLALSYLEYGEYGVDLFDDYFGSLFQEKINSISKIKLTPNDLVSFLHPATISSVVRYQQELLRLSLKQQVPTKSISKIVNELGWIHMGWDGDGELSIKDVRRAVVILRKKSKVTRVGELEKFNEFSAGVGRERKNILAKHKINPAQLKIYFELLDKFVLYHDYRKEIQMRANQVIYRVLREITRRFKLSFDDLMYYNNPEVKNLLLNNEIASIGKINKRRSGMLWVLNQGKVKEYLGSEAKKKARELVWS